MKELVKPNKIEETYTQLESLVESCERYCEPPQTCNKHCSGQGTTNRQAVDDSDILF